MLRQPRRAAERVAGEDAAGDADDVAEHELLPGDPEMRIDLARRRTFVEARRDRGRLADVDLPDQAPRGPLPENAAVRCRAAASRTIAATLSARSHAGLALAGVGARGRRLRHRSWSAVAQWIRPHSICELNTVHTARRRLRSRDSGTARNVAGPRQVDRDIGQQPRRPLAQHDDVVGEQHRFGDVMGDEHDGGAGFDRQALQIALASPYGSARRARRTARPSG